MALVLTVKEGETIKIDEDITIQVKRKRRSNGTLQGVRFSVAIEAPRETNIAREHCKNKENNDDI